MKSIVLFSTAILCFSSSSAQDSISGQLATGKPHTVHVVTMDGSVLKGILYEATPSGISVIKSKKETGTPNSFSSEEIKKLYLRRKGNVGLGMVIGAVVGTVIGATIGGSSKNDKEYHFDPLPNPPAYNYHEKAIIGGTVGFISGAGLGLIVGALTKKKFIIQGKKENYQLKYTAIVERAMIQHQ